MWGVPTPSAAEAVGRLDLTVGGGEGGIWGLGVYGPGFVVQGPAAGRRVRGWRRLSPCCGTTSLHPGYWQSAALPHGVSVAAPVGVSSGGAATEGSGTRYRHRPCTRATANAEEQCSLSNPVRAQKMLLSAEVADPPAGSSAVNV